MTNNETASYTPPLFALSAATYVERDGKILLLKRAGGAATGAWYIPGGAVDPGETVEEAACRELLEEAGLAPSGPLTCIGVVHMHVYGYPSLQVVYACECADGDVTISHEHSGARWIDPVEYRERYFTDEAMAAAEAVSPHYGEMISNVRTNLDSYLRWREDRRRLQLTAKS
jgi:8-oxo-dGTP pyrophosphatase MutT (NUDIX family)